MKQITVTNVILLREGRSERGGSLKRNVGRCQEQSFWGEHLGKALTGLCHVTILVLMEVQEPCAVVPQALLALSGLFLRTLLDSLYLLFQTLGPYILLVKRWKMFQGTRCSQKDQLASPGLSPWCLALLFVAVFLK